MKKPWIVVPMLAAAALVASAYWWKTHQNDWSPPLPRQPDLPQYIPMASPSSASTVQALARPLLWTNRRPVESKNESQKNQQEQELAQSRLLAVLESGGDRIALLQHANGTLLKLTSESKPWRLESFDGRRAIFFSDEAKRSELFLEYATPPASQQRQGRTPRP
jgi:hypothetical protein